jgi:hypothetical protein
MCKNWDFLLAGVDGRWAYRVVDDLAPVADDEDPNDGGHQHHVERPEVEAWQHATSAAAFSSENRRTSIVFILLFEEKPLHDQSFSQLWTLEKKIHTTKRLV